MAADYRGGLSLRAVAAKYRCGKTSVLRALAACGEAARPGTLPSPAARAARDRRVVADWLRHRPQTVAGTARRCGVTWRAAAGALDRAGLRGR